MQEMIIMNFGALRQALSILDKRLDYAVAVEGLQSEDEGGKIT